MRGGSPTRPVPCGAIFGLIICSSEDRLKFWAAVEILILSMTETGMPVSVA